MNKDSVDNPEEQGINLESRRRFLGRGVSASVTALVATGAVGSAVAAEAKKATDVLPIAPSNKILGRGVVNTPYGLPSKFEKDV